MAYLSSEGKDSRFRWNLKGTNKCQRKNVTSNRTAAQMALSTWVLNLASARAKNDNELARNCEPCDRRSSYKSPLRTRILRAGLYSGATPRDLVEVSRTGLSHGE